MVHIFSPSTEETEADKFLSWIARASYIEKPCLQAKKKKIKRNKTNIVVEIAELVKCFL